MSKLLLLICTLTLLHLGAAEKADWQLGPFQRIDEVNPILSPSADSKFFCPIQGKEIQWEAEHLFNPGAVVHNGSVYLIYRAEDDYGTGIGNHTSRLGLAASYDGMHFRRTGTPVLFPDRDNQSAYEFPGGCEDPRIVDSEEGTYIMTYTQWNRQMPVLSIASSKDLVHWEKHGYAFEGKMRRKHSKAGSIVCRVEDDRLIATKIQDKYWMYWGEGHIHVAVSDDLITWEPILDADDERVVALEPRNGKFDSLLVEPGPPAIITENGILLLYNGKNSVVKGDNKVTPRAYSGGQALFDLSCPARLIARSDEHFLTPERSYETNGQYRGGTVFIQGLVPFNGDWLLYYGAADSVIGVAKCPMLRNED